MSTYRATLTFVAAIVLVLILACGDQAAAPEIPVDAEPTVVEWSIGPKGGLGEGSAFITQHRWEPKKLKVPVNYPFMIRFVPRDDTTDTIVFSRSLKEELGIELEDLKVQGGQPADTPVMIIRSGNKSFDVFSREHRGVGGSGTVITPDS